MNYIFSPQRHIPDVSGDDSSHVTLKCWSCVCPHEMCGVAGCVFVFLMCISDAVGHLTSLRFTGTHSHSTVILTFICESRIVWLIVSNYTSKLVGKKDSRFFLQKVGKL